MDSWVDSLHGLLDRTGHQGVGAGVLVHFAAVIRSISKWWFQVFVGGSTTN